MSVGSECLLRGNEWWGAHRFSVLIIPFLAVTAMCGISPCVLAFQIKLFPASDVYDADTEFLHERLGVAGLPLKTEDFEDTELEPWLRTNVKAGGSDTELHAWSGRLASTFSDSAAFEITLPNIRLFGVGLSDNDGGNERISINGNSPIPLNQLPGYEGNSGGRAFFALIAAAANDPDIRSIAFDKCFTVHFDHLLISQEVEPAEAASKLAPRLILSLTDGTRLVATADSDFIQVSIQGQKLDLAVERIASMHFHPGTNTATALLQNGEKISCQLEFTELKLSTLLGKFSLPRNNIKQLKVTPRGRFQPRDIRESNRLKTAFHAEEPIYDGKTLRRWNSMAGPQPRAGKMQDALSPDFDAKSPEQQRARQAIRSIGPAALPFLLELLQRGGVDAHTAVRGFEQLGDLGKEALPDLLLLLDEPNDTLHFCVIWSIGHIGPAAKGAVPVLLDELRRSPQPHVAAEALGNIGPAAVAAVPLILQKLKQGDYPYDLPFIIALGKFGSRDAVPELEAIALGNDARRKPEERGFVSQLRRHRAVEALGNLGPEARDAVPVLIQLLKQQSLGSLTDLYMAERIIRALGNMGTSAYEAVPVLREIADKEDRATGLQKRIAQSAASALAQIHAVSK